MPRTYTRKHGGYSLVKPLEVTKYLGATRRALIRDIGGSEDSLSAQQVILIDGCINILGIIRSMELYIAKNEVMQGGLLAPCLRSHYLSYRNSLHKTLAMLGLDRSKIEKIMTIEQVKKAIDKEVAEKGSK